MLSKILFGALVSLELASRSGWIVLLPRGNVAPPLDGGDRLDGTGARERERECVCSWHVSSSGMMGERLQYISICLTSMTYCEAYCHKNIGISSNDLPCFLAKVLP